MEKLLHGKLIRSSGNFLSVTDLQNIYDEIIVLNTGTMRRVTDILQTNKFVKSTYDLIFNNKNYESKLLIYEYYTFSNFKIECDKFGTVKVLKKLGLWKTTGARHTKQTMCDEKIWKFLYINMYNEHSSINMPNWIKEIDINFYRFSIKRDESLELNFIDNLIYKIDLFLIDKAIKQRKLWGYIYDLYIQIFDKSILIEYNEIHHNSKADEDYKKAYEAYDNLFYIIYIPQGHENDVKAYLNDIIKNKLTIDDCIQLCDVRFNKIIEHTYDKQINKKIFGTESNTARLSASYQQLKDIIKIRDFISNLVHIRYVKNYKDIHDAIEKIKI